MLVVSYADFSADINKYLDTARNEGIKIIPVVQTSKTSRKHKKFINILNSVTGIIPSDADLDKEKTEV